MTLTTRATTASGVANKGAPLSNAEIDDNTVEVALRAKLADKDASGGYAGLTLFKINMKNVAGSITSWLTNTNTVARTYTLPNKDGTVAMTSDVTGVNSGTNTGDETTATIKTKLGVSTLSGSNTGDETGASVAALNHAAAVKSALVDADETTGQDSAAGWGLIRTTWGSIKVFLKTYFDTLYATKVANTFTGAQTAPSFIPNSSTVPTNGMYTAGTNTLNWSTNSVLRLTLSSTGDLTATGNVTAYSDERLKTNWRDLPDSFIERLALVKSGIYDRTDQSGTQIGVSAQSLAAIMPHAVLEDADGMLSVAYGNAALTACVMLAREVQNMKATLAAMKAAP